MEDDILINGKHLGVEFIIPEEWPDTSPPRDKYNDEEFQKEFMGDWDKESASKALSGYHTVTKLDGSKGTIHFDEFGNFRDVEEGEALED